MTTIAYDGYDLVADTQATSGTQKVDGVDKVFEIPATGKNPKCWVGLAGAMHRFPEVIKWVKGGCKKPEPVLNDEVSGILIDSSGHVMILIDDDGVRWEYWSTPVAIGTGGELAMGAMLAGKKAKQAVLIAARVDTQTGNKVKVYNINQRKTRTKREKTEDGLLQVHRERSLEARIKSGRRKFQ